MGPGRDIVFGHCVWSVTGNMFIGFYLKTKNHTTHWQDKTGGEPFMYHISLRKEMELFMKGCEKTTKALTFYGPQLVEKDNFVTCWSVGQFERGKTHNKHVASRKVAGQSIALLAGQTDLTVDSV